jgi:hypothetical protein
MQLVPVVSHKPKQQQQRATVLLQEAPQQQQEEQLLRQMVMHPLLQGSSSRPRVRVEQQGRKCRRQQRSCGGGACSVSGLVGMQRAESVVPGCS